MAIFHSMNKLENLSSIQELVVLPIRSSQSNYIEYENVQRICLSHLPFHVLLIYSTYLPRLNNSDDDPRAFQHKKGR